MGMKEKFFEIIAEIKSTGIVDILSNATSSEEMESIWERFSKEKEEIFEKAKKWASEYYTESLGIKKFLFKKGDIIENPLEIILVPFICGDSDEICFDDLFEDFNSEMIIEPLRETENKFATVVADYIESGISELEDISSEDIFEKLNS